ncbi:MAG: hypothetical protein NXI30_04345 [bacterium]|nr:hypothetical protein [bacterium]
MSEGKYGEPWTLYATHFNGERHPRIVSLDEDSEGAILHDIGGMPEEMAHFQRAVACVNAFQGIPDPSAYRTAVEGLVNRVRVVLENNRLTDCDGGDYYEINADEIDELRASLARVEGGGE